MTKNLDRRKYKLIQEIIQMDDEAAIARIEDQVSSIRKEDNIWHAVMKPMRKTISLTEMKEKQNYIPMEEETFFELAAKIEIEESIEELLAMLD
jgi:hypothetical protein